MEKYLISEAFNKLKLTESGMTSQELMDKPIVDRLFYAYSSKTDPALLSVLSNDADSDVRANVAGNLNANIDTLKKLALDKVDYVRLTLSENPNTPLDILEKLANDSNKYVRRGIADNTNTPLDILKKLKNDEDAAVRKIVNRRIPYEANENEFGYTDDDFSDFQ